MIFGKDLFQNYLAETFMCYLTNTAAAVRYMGIEMSGKLAKAFSSDWIVEQYIPRVENHYGQDKKGYNYRMACLYSLSAVLPYTPKDAIQSKMIPIFDKALKDDVPNVKFCMAKIILDNKQYLDKDKHNLFHLLSDKLKTLGE